MQRNKHTIDCDCNISAKDRQQACGFIMIGGTSPIVSSGVNTAHFFRMWKTKKESIEHSSISTSDLKTNSMENGKKLSAVALTAMIAGLAFMLYSSETPKYKK